MKIFKIQLPMVLLVDLALLFVGCSSSQQTAAPETTAQRSTNAVSTDPHVNAILEQSCYECHSTQSVKLRGGLLLDSRDGIRKGGDNGPAVVPGKPDEGLLLKSLRHEKLKMPKKKLTDAVIAELTQPAAASVPART